MFITEIKESEWKTFDEIVTMPNVPYWFKLENGNIVLSIWISTEHSRGWAKAFFDDDFVLKYKTDTFYILKGAKLQCAIK